MTVRSDTHNVSKDTDFRNLKTRDQVFQLVLKGLGIKDISKQVQLSEKGVKYHLTHIYRHYEVKNKIELIMLSIEKPEILNDSPCRKQGKCPLVSSLKSEGN